MKGAVFKGRATCRWLDCAARVATVCSRPDTRGLTFVGGDADSLRTGTGVLLRQPINELVGVDGAATYFTC